MAQHYIISTYDPRSFKPLLYSFNYTVVSRNLDLHQGLHILVWLIFSQVSHWLGFHNAVHIKHILIPYDQMQKFGFICQIMNAGL